MAQLPDPTVDLDWSGHIGAIHEIFAANTQKHPDRVCVVETKSSEGPERSYTYRQIFEASNVLAHYLHDAGVTNGDIVMIWAHRSVDLVVSIMGVLASGATFSVLDPLYPPARQQIYLEVSGPTALVNIARATDEAGPLAPLVRKYIDEELKLKAEVPSLRIGDDGFLSGGEIDGKDVFAGVRNKASAPPADVLVGPDSNPTLSFTSGSEGRPKGVLGRHYSLAKYFAWMAETFGLSDQSRFTLLSGIAHDPVQRDIFTPLFLGAQLLVPSKEHIAHERLAEWFREFEPTVTHLTPAMGQILVGGASAEFPALRTAFFVGDVLTTRDCRTLRTLAVNVDIINMYGTTETSRAVSYYRVPNRATDPDFLERLDKDTIPAGRGMQNVQLLVVNREDRTKLCGVGEVGEIYVRAAGLGEGYKGDPAMNEQKFLNNWFVDNNKWVEADKQHPSQGQPWRKHYKGPRDRLYRTGDLGKYLESGDVECTGRADDQVKIRGFRIELNDIDSNLSQSSLIRDCKTLVRRDRNEEPSLVSYVVPELKEWPLWLKAQGHEDAEDDPGVEFGPTRVFFKRFRRLQTELRDHLKGRLPAYAVPTLFIVLEKLPLNPNGKVDKPNLPFPDIAEQTTEASGEELKRWDSLSETEKRIAAKWASLIRGLNVKTIAPEHDFFDLGGHSILAQQMLLDVRKDTGANVSINTLYANPTLAAFSAQVDKQLGSGAANGSAAESEADSYSKARDDLVKKLPVRYQTADPATIRASSRPTVFLTGATGFLGAFLIRDILQRTSRQVRLVAHVRAKDEKAAMERLRRSLQGYGLWRDEWATRLSCAVGDLSKPQLGIEQTVWDRLAAEVDVVIHNGATVHWVRRWQDMLAANVTSTVDAMRLCNGVSRPDTRTGLGRRGPRLGDSESGCCNTDDFLIRFLKGCIQLGSRPRIVNTVNSVPVNHVARVVAAAALNPLPAGVSVVHVTGHPRLRMSEYLSLLEYYGYRVPEVSYGSWKEELERYVSAGGGVERDQEQHALLPLFHLCISDLPANTKAPELDDENAVTVLKADAENWTGVDESAGYGIGREDVGRYLRYLATIKFLPWPAGKGRPLPEISFDAQQALSSGAAVVGGRGGVSK
ncbi:L-aminoadipate-semialdehyde dehydrogenase [Magnaporthiopsis poae ATCC 64411]|uniref:Alpha-aminoadipate reductase n=1 Tax=Magnaporthiopsis poae (strain ATCC 64411 / 73-15) TaxID=644358 RepID=A0A0C4ECH8_MAGP6|nr:L-aminoadipate-semialdehyde dehydrogenase [Magnaporthiopsis poae ATCC 64411]